MKEEEDVNYQPSNFQKGITYQRKMKEKKDGEDVEYQPMSFQKFQGITYERKKKYRDTKTKINVPDIKAEKTKVKKRKRIPKTMKAKQKRAKVLIEEPEGTKTDHLSKICKTTPPPAKKKTHTSTTSKRKSSVRKSLNFDSASVFPFRIPKKGRSFKRRQLAIVPYSPNNKEDSRTRTLEVGNDAIVPLEVKLVNKAARAKAAIDEETLREWKMLLTLESSGGGGGDDDRAKWWEEERRFFHGRVLAFTSRMNAIQGNRRFSPWKGSVLDSVIGVFLTQNVSDILSSSAFMSLAARFPLKSEGNYECENNILKTQKHEEFRKIVVDKHSKVKLNSSSSKGRVAREKAPDWSKLKHEAVGNEKAWEKTDESMDSLDWEAVRLANVDEVADAIRIRGMNNVLASRIKEFLDRLVEEHENIDLEWLRHVSPPQVKEYLMSIRGLGLKSAECVRLLILKHNAFPVDTNISRVAVRLGWVPLEPLDESVQLHLLEQYPFRESIQKFLWTRLCKLDQSILYELHYHMITFGKIFCTKRNPNCNACPMKAECKHYASAFASSRLALPGLQEKSLVCRNENLMRSEPIIEEPTSPELEISQDFDVIDIEDVLSKTLFFSSEKDPVIPMPRRMNVFRLRTKHFVYELADSHYLLDKLDKREPNDPGKYLVAIWSSDESLNSVANPLETCTLKEESTIKGTLLIPCRTAMRGRFPLNGTYFQVNEVFADYESSINSIDIQISSLWNLQKRLVYFGSTVSSIFRDLPIESIRQCCREGYVCLRAFDRKTRAPQPLNPRFHFSVGMKNKTKQKR